MKELKNTRIPLFRKCIIQNFPFIAEDFDALTDYGFLSKVVEYLNKVIEQQNITSDAVNYIINYFNNLDVQDEIDNKLDEMVEDGSLETIISRYINDNFLICVNTVNDLKGLNVADGQRVKTLGYYSVNDGGSGMYLIKNNQPSYFYESLNNGKYAELIFNNEINIKQFGAHGNGSTDDSSIIQNAINSIRSYTLNKSNPYELITLFFPAGTYKITQTINLSPLVKINTLGTVIFESYNNGSAFKILPQSNDNAEWYNYNGKYITSSDGIMIVNKYSSRSNTIGLEIGTTSSVGNFKGLMHSIIEDLTFIDYNVGILMNSVNNYCNDFNNLKFINDGYNIQWGNSESPANNAGERITFRNCQFGSNDTFAVVAFYSDIADINFVDCSFDYCNCIFLDLGKKGYSNINVSQCHIEGVSYNLNDSQLDNIPYGIVYGEFKYTNINFFQCNIGVYGRRKMFHYGATSLPYYTLYRLNILDCEIGTNERDLTNNYNKLYWIDENINAYVRNSCNHLQIAFFPNLKNNQFQTPFFDTESTGSVDAGTNQTVGGWLIFYNPGFLAEAEIVTNNTTEKNALKLKAKANNPTIQIKSEKIDIKPGDKLNICAMSKNFYKVTCYIKYYDNDDNEITEVTRTPYYTNIPPKANDYVNDHTIQEYAPYRARKFDVRFLFSNTGQTDTVLIDDYCYIEGLFCYKN